MTINRTIPLRLKLGATALLIEFLTVLLLTWQGVNLSQDQLAEEYATSIAELLPVLASAIVTPLLEEDVATLETIIRPLMHSSNGNIEAVKIHNSAGETIWSINESAFREVKLLGGPSETEYHPKQLLDHLSVAEPDQSFRASTVLTLAGSPVGNLQLIFRTDRLFAKLNNVARSGILAGTVAMALGSLVFVLLARTLTTNLIKMQRAADSVSQGNYQTRLEINSNDELGGLARAFNRMARQIASDWQQLDEREQHIRFTLNSIADGVIAVDNDGAITQINPVACELTGHQPDQAIGKPVEQIFQLIDLQGTSVVPPVRQALENSLRVNLSDHIRLVSPGGTEHLIKARAAPIVNAQQQTVGAIMVFHDNSEEYQHQQQLQRQHEQLTTAETVANMGSWSRDLQTQALHWSPGFYQVVDIDSAETPSYEKLLPRLSPEAQQQIALALEQQKSRTFTFKVSRRNGQVRDLQVTVQHIYDGQPQPLRVVGVVLDVTAKLAASRASRESEQMLLSVINKAPALVVVKARDGRILHSNKTHADIFGLTPEDLIGKTSHDFHSQEDADSIVARDEQVFRTGENFEKVETLFNGTENRIYTSTRTPLLDEKGEVYALVFLAWDVTEQSQQQDVQLGRQKMEALGQLTGGVAHDYNNMLAIILGYAELLETRVQDDPQSTSYTREILNAGRRSAEMTKKLLGFAQLQPGQAVASQLNDLLEDKRDLLVKTAADQVTLTLELSGDLWPVQIDAGEFGDALINLTVNARQAMPAGGNLTIQTSNQRLTARQLRTTRLAPGDYVKVSVIDNGTGMTRQTMERVLEPFFTTKGSEGTGLGLSQVYGFVQRAGGDIQITSTFGQGSQFTLYFPRTDVAVAAAAEGTATLVYADRLPLVRGRILLVDDEPALVEVSNEILTARGYLVTPVNSGNAALKHLTEAAESGLGFDLLVSDIVMPNMDGQRLAELARQQQPGLKVLFVSGYNQASAIKLQPGHTELLTKPFSANELLSKTGQMLDSANHSA